MEAANQYCTYMKTLDGINALTWSPDGEYIASAGDDQTIQIWHAKTRERRFTHRQWGGRIMAVNWSPDGEHIVSGTWDGIVEECEASSDQHTFSLQANIIKKEGAIATTWRPDLSLIAFGGGDRRIEVADMLTGKLFLCRGSVQPVEIVGQGQMPTEIPPITSTETITTDTTTTTTTTTLQPGPAGSRVLHTSTRQSRAVKVWGGREMSDIVIYRGHVGAVAALAWSPDSTRIASASYDGTIQVWDAITCTTIFTYHGHIDPVVTVAWSPNGQLLVSGSLDKTARVWDIFTGQEIQAYRGHKDFVSTVTWSPDSKRVASDSEDGNIHIWDVTNGESIYISQEHTGSVTAVAWSPDGRYLASGGEDQTVSIQEVATKQILFTYRGHSGAVRAVAWSPDSKHIASGSDWNRELEPADEQRPERKATIHIWSPTGEREVIYCSDEQPHASANALTWSPDGTMVAVTTIFSGAEVYDAVTGEKIAQIWNTGERGNRTGKNLSIDWSPDGTRIAAGMSTGEVKIWPAG